MRRPALPTRSHADVGMTAMIDVVFLLLIFFVWTSSFDPPEGDLLGRFAATMNQQAASTASTSQETPLPLPPMDEIIITIARADGIITWQLNDVPFDSLDALNSRLQKITSLDAPPPQVVLDPAGDVPVPDVIETLDMVGRCGFEQVYFAVANAP